MTDHSNQKEKSAGAALFVDKDRIMILNAMMWVCEASIPFQLAMIAKGKKDTLDSFWEEIAKVMHDNKWCTDPQCTYEEKHRK